MEFERNAVIAVVLGATVLFLTEALSVDLVAILAMCALVLGGVLTPQEGLAGFSDQATITVAAMFVLSAGLSNTGAVQRLAGALSGLVRRNLSLGVITFMPCVGVISAFINNTACVAVFLPVCLELARRARVSPSKLLMPVSFAAIFGGTCTLIGTSTNFVVSSLAVKQGHAPFAMFEFTQLGVVTMGIGILYMAFFGIRLLPDRRPVGDLTRSFSTADYITEVILLPGGPNVGQHLAECPLVGDLDLDVLEIHRDGEVLAVPRSDIILHADDELRVRCDVEKLKTLQKAEGIRLKPDRRWTDKTLESEQAVLVEAVIGPRSILSGHSLKSANFRERFGATAIAIRHQEEILHEKLGTVTLRGGDTLLIEVPRDRVEQLQQNPNFLFVNKVGPGDYRPARLITALGIFTLVVMLSTVANISLPILALAGAVAMILTGCLNLEQAYRSLDLRVLFLIAGSLSMGLAVEKTGLASSAAGAMVHHLSGWGPVAIVGGVYLITMILTELLSNTATAALVTPLALEVAGQLAINPRPLLIAVTFAASASFVTPVGYQTNTMVYGPGHYKFRDFTKVGLPLSLMFWLVASVLIPYFWPLTEAAK